MGNVLISPEDWLIQRGIWGREQGMEGGGGGGKWGGDLCLIYNVTAG